MKTWSALLVGLFLSSSIVMPVKAQITIDGTTNTTLTPIENGIRIDDGNRKGNNLFHSFEQFSVFNGSEAFFNNVDDIVNIFSRVTGGNISNIDGLLRANGTANLFLLNPAGIIFGENAQLDIGGSFLSSTADSIVFSDGEFLATDSDEPPLLTINMPIGLNLGNNPGDIVNRSYNGNGLEVATGEDITLVGGNINLEGGRIYAPGGRVELGGLSTAGEVGINADGSLIFPEGVTRADVTLTNGANVTVIAGGGGIIGVNARNIELSAKESNISFLFAGIARNSGSPEAQAGDIILNATENITVSQRSAIANQVLPTGVGHSGGINITTTDLSLEDGSVVSTSTFGQGNTGVVNISAEGTILLNNSSIFSRVGRESGVGNSGGINITTGSLKVTNGARVNASTSGQGNAGQVTINAEGAVSLDGVNRLPTAVLSNVEVGATGNSGGVNIMADSLSVTNGSLIESRTRGNGNAADVDIQVRNGITFNGLNSSRIGNSGVYSGVEKGAKGQGGDIRISTGSLILQDGARIENSTFGQGNAGAINIKAADTVSFNDRSTVRTIVGAGAEGNSGGIDITTTNLELTTSSINSSTFGKGNAGAITIDASDTISAKGFDGGVSGIFSVVGISTEAEGNAGDITITTTNLNLTQTGQVNSSTFAQGNGGDINIEASGTIFIEGDSPNGLDSSSIASVVDTRRENVEAEGNAGDITITTANLNLTQGGQVTATTFARGDAGEITINASDTISADGENQKGDNSGIFSIVSAVGESKFSTLKEPAIGNAGGIEITTTNLELRGGGQVTASTRGQGNTGNLMVTASELIELVGSDGVSPSGLFANAINGNGDAKSLTVNTEQLIVRDSAVITVGNFDQVVEGKSETLPPGTGAAGNLEINARSVEVSNKGKITANNANGFGGQLTLNADSLTLEKQASISAETTADRGQGGILTLNIDDTLFMSQGSSISARADRGANGGNVNINSDLIVAFPNQNNDIIANAEQGTGGNIEITTRGIFGIEERPLNSFTNDINASSEFGLDGTITINILDVNPASGIEDLPKAVIDPDKLVLLNLCSLARDSEFYYTAKGGNTPDPVEIRDEGVIAVDLVEPVPFEEEKDLLSRGAGVQKGRGAEEVEKEIVEAQGWIFHENGVVELVAYKTDPNGAPAQPKYPRVCSK